MNGKNLETIYEDEFITISYSEKNSILIHKWSDFTNQLTNEKFKFILEKTSYMIKNKNIDGILIDSSNFKFILDPELQEWLEGKYKQVFPSLSKIAYIIPNLLISDYSISQTFEKILKLTDLEKFSQENDALNWLLSN